MQAMSVITYIDNNGILYRTPAQYPAANLQVVRSLLSPGTCRTIPAPVLTVECLFIQCLRSVPREKQKNILVFV